MPTAARTYRTRKVKQLCPSCKSTEEPEPLKGVAWNIVVCVKCSHPRLDPPVDDVPFAHQALAGDVLKAFRLLTGQRSNPV